MAGTKNNLIRRQYRTVHFLCSLLFCVLTFSYLYFYKGDILAVAQHVLSGGATTYDSLIGASVITAVLLLIQFFVHSAVPLNRLLYSFTYLPSFLCLAVITDISPGSDSGVYDRSWLWIAPLILVLYVFTVRFVSELDSLSKDDKPVTLFSKSCWVNMLCITLMMLVTVSQGNNDITLHHRARIENMIFKGDYEAAPGVGKNYHITDSSLTMLRAYSLSLNNKLPDKLFEYSLCGGSKAFYPDGKTTGCLMLYDGDVLRYIHRRNMGSASVENDYRLCGLLADCRIRQFASELPKYHKVDSLLPKHYKEAVVLYNHITGDSIKGYSGNELENNFKSFISIYSKCNGKKEIMAYVAPRFSKTYWYYYALRSRL